MKPTIGRTVWFRPSGAYVPRPGAPVSEFLPAVIVHVESETKVSLQVFTNDHRGVRWEPGVELGTAPGQWQWPEVIR